MYKFRNIFSTYGEQDFEHLLNKSTFLLLVGVWTNGPVESLFQLINVTFYHYTFINPTQMSKESCSRKIGINKFISRIEMQ